MRTRTHTHTHTHIHIHTIDRATATSERYPKDCRQELIHENRDNRLIIPLGNPLTSTSDSRIMTPFYIQGACLSSQVAKKITYVVVIYRTWAGIGSLFTAVF